METSRVSVAMCTYNGARFLPEQLKSIAAQTKPPDELVICDDRSTDDTADIVRAFAATAPFRVSFTVNDVRLGTPANFARAISLCQFELIALCDQDDVWQARKLDRLSGFLFANQGIGAVFSDAELIDADSAPLEGTLWSSYTFNSRKQNRFDSGQGLKVLLKEPEVTGATMVFRSRFRRLVLPIPLEGHHDLWISMLIASVSHLAPQREMLIRYRKHAAQQVGPGERLSFWEKLPRRAGPDYYLREVKWLGEICERLEERGVEFPPHPDALRLIRQKINHRKARGEFPDSKILRVPSVVREAASLRYWRFSSGLGSMMKDLLV
jgi:glycosyltransferase involved in cell wall biosynthesis